VNNHHFSPRRALVLAGLVGAGNAFYGAPAHAQQSEIDVLRQQMAELQARLDALDAAQKATDKTISGAKPVINTKSPVVVSGLLQVHLLNYFNQGLPTGTGRTQRNADTFRLRRGELRLTAPKITDRVSATVMFDPAKDTTSSNARNNILQEIVVSYALQKTKTGSTSIDIGQFKIPVGYESLVSSAALPFVERPLIFTSRDPFGGGYGDVRDTGVQLTSKYQDFELRAGIFNGIGDRQNALALSTNKAYLGRLAYTGLKNLTLGVSGGSGNTGVSNTVNGGAVIRNANRTLLNFFGAYNKNKVYAAAEYLRGNAVPIAFGVNSTTNNPIVLNGRDVQGYYGTLGYYFTPKLQGLFRYDNFDTNRDLGGSKLRDYTLGANYYLKGNEAKVQFNIIDHNRGSAITGSPKGTELRTAFQATF